VLAIYREEHVLEQGEARAPTVARAFEELGKVDGVLRTRALGMVGAADLAVPLENERGYLSELGWKVSDEARKRGAYLRPLGSTVYVCPPLNIAMPDLEQLLAILHESVVAALASEGL
jgi:adenosylmethionine-8-amino-7-oxononanoate aminotransferase